MFDQSLSVKWKHGTWILHVLLLFRDGCGNFTCSFLDYWIFLSLHQVISMLFQLVLWVLSGHRERKQYSYNNSSTVWFEIVFYSQEVQGFQEDLWVRANHEVPGNTQTHTHAKISQ